MTRVMLAATLLGTGAAMTVVTVPTFRPSLWSGPQAEFTETGGRKHQRQPRTIEQSHSLHSDPTDILYEAAFKRQVTGSMIVVGLS